MITAYNAIAIVLRRLAMSDHYRSRDNPRDLSERRNKGTIAINVMFIVIAIELAYEFHNTILTCFTYVVESAIAYSYS